MHSGNRSRKLAISIDADVNKSVIASAARDRVSVSDWMTTAAREALKRRAGLAAIEVWEKQHGRLSAKEMNEARRSVRAQIPKQRTTRRLA